MKLKILIFLLLLFNLSGQCDQRKKIENLKFGKTLFVFITAFMKNDARSKDDNDKVYYMYEEVMCAIPNQDEFSYATTDKDNYYKEHDDLYSAKSAIMGAKMEGRRYCYEFFNSIHFINKYVNKRITTQTKVYDRVEIFFFIPYIPGGYKKCEYVQTYREFNFFGHLNFISFDDQKYPGYHTLNIPNSIRESINISKTNAEVKKLAENFIDGILDIPPAPEPVKKPEIRCGFSPLLSVIVSIGGLIIGNLITIAFVKLVIEKTRLRDWFRKRFGKRGKKVAIVQPKIVQPLPQKNVENQVKKEEKPGEPVKLAANNKNPAKKPATAEKSEAESLKDYTYDEEGNLTATTPKTENIDYDGVYETRARTRTRSARRPQNSEISRKKEDFDSSYG